jgi:aminoglycoside phosphotransferase (APT) family kinase protein
VIPEEKSDAVSRGLSEAFDKSSSIEEIRSETRGLSSDLVFRIVVRGSPYLLRIMTRMDERNDPVRIFACMKAAADARLAPRVLYASVQDGVAIIDWIETAPLPTTEALVHLAATIRELHALQPFPKTFNFVTAHKFFIWRLRTAGLLPEGEVEEVFRNYERLCAVYPRLDSDTVSSHMDLKPDNILYDGRRVWLADWTAAFLNDRYFDLAIVANFVVKSDTDERNYLGKYFGRPPDPYELARFFLMRQVTHMLSAAVFLLLSSTCKPVRRNNDPPSFHDFHERIWAGEIDLADNELKIVYGLVHWEQLLKNIRHPRFDEAMRLVGERSARMHQLHLLLPSAS